MVAATVSPGYTSRPALVDAMSSAVQVTVVRRELPTCGRCRNPLRRHASLVEGLCCCERGTCHSPEPFGCQLCDRVLMSRTEEVLGLCVVCQVTGADQNRPYPSVTERE